jgi:hypothetical protein
VKKKKHWTITKKEQAQCRNVLHPNDSRPVLGILFFVLVKKMEILGVQVQRVLVLCATRLQIGTALVAGIGAAPTGHHTRVPTTSEMSIHILGTMVSDIRLLENSLV